MAYVPIADLGWIDFSETDKNKAMKALEMWQDAGTVDELGVGVVRDALSDAMFPGITTIMTRAKYYFIVPRIIHSYLSDEKIQKRISLRKYLNDRENEIMQELAQKYDFDEEQRIIGINIAKHNKGLPSQRKKELARKPSSIYWNGMKAYGIYRGQLPLSIFLQHFDNKSIFGEKGFDAYDSESGDDRDANLNEESPFYLPDYDRKWSNDLSIDLSADEADFLKQKIIDRHPATLLAKTIGNVEFTQQFLDAAAFSDLMGKPFINELPGSIKAVVQTAGKFWQIMDGAHIRYNIILHSRHGSSDKALEFTSKWNTWLNVMQAFNWEEFNRPLMWEITKSHSHVKPFTERFINEWMNNISTSNFDADTLDGMVEKQELKNKGARSKLRPGNDDKYNNWIGIAEMNFRFRNAKLIIQDIQEGGNRA